MAGSARLDINGAVATITLDNESKRNSLDFSLLEQLTSAAEHASNSSEIAVVVLRGAGDKAFCAGADFDAFASRATLQEGVAALDEAFARAVAALKIPSPVIAAIGGACFGGGVQLALSADIRIAAEHSKFGIPAVQVGLAYPLSALERLITLVGAGNASQILLTAMPFDAPTALRYRLINEIVSGNLAERTKILADAIANSPTTNSRTYKAIINGIAARAIDGTVVSLHERFADDAHYLPKLEAIALQRRERAISDK